MGNSSINGNVENTRWSKNNPIKQKRDAAKGRFKKQQETDQENQQERRVNKRNEIDDYAKRRLNKQQETDQNFNTSS